MCEASFARRHALYVQVFQPDELVFINQPAAAEFLPGQLAGKAAAFLLCLPVVLWRRNLLASRPRGKRPQAQIKPDPLACKHRLCHLHLDLDTDLIPPALGPRYGYVLQYTSQRTMQDQAHMPKLYRKFLLLCPVRIDAILEPLADDPGPFCASMYGLTPSSDTDPTEAMNRERVHMDGSRDFIQGYALRMVLTLWPLILRTTASMPVRGSTSRFSDPHPMVGHDFHLKHPIVVLCLLFEQQRFEPGIHRWHEYLVPLFRAKDNLVLTTVNHLVTPV
jgi:hypothetical protein